MIAWAPITKFVDWWTTSDYYRELMILRPSPLGLATLKVARTQIGKGELGGNNIGPDLDRYRGPRGGTGSWCAAFVYWCAWRAAQSRRHRVPFARTHGARKLFRRAVRSGMLVPARAVMAGDLVLWSRGNPNKPEERWKAHIGIVSEVERDRGKVLGWKYIAGNEGKYPALVLERYGHKRGRLVGFARLG